jgi:hypothetical protein
LGPKDAIIALNAERHLKYAESVDWVKREFLDTLLHEMIHGRFFCRPKLGILRANELTAYELVRCTGHPRYDRMVKGDDDLEHGVNFYDNANAVRLRVSKDFESLDVG